MILKKAGSQSVKLASPPVISGYSCVVGKREGQGPLKKDFDKVVNDSFWGEKTWEKAESKMVEYAVGEAISKAGLTPDKLDRIFAGDLLNQCVSSTFGIRDYDIPYYGIYGACSNMAESLSLAAMMIDGGFAEHAAAVTSSHFCSAERQYRFPLEYGGQRTPSSQWTVTGAGAAVVSASGHGPKIEALTCGKIADMGIKDANNMGAAMAPAAYNTLTAHFEDLGIEPDYYDLIVTGDLGFVGSEILRELFSDSGKTLMERYNDCGLMVFSREEQDVGAGGSGCGCSAVVLCGHILKKLSKGELKRVLFAATGALMSPLTAQQGETIPGICHAVAITA